MMNHEELNTALYEKMAAEQNSFRDWLKGQPPEEILNHAHEYSVREDMVIEMEELDLTEAQAAALLKSPSPLADIYKEWEKTETNYMNDVRDVIENRADHVIRDEREAMMNTPVYLQDGNYAREHGELDTLRASFMANISCRKAIETAINANYADNFLDAAAAYREVLGKFSPERVELVLAATVRHKEWDGRFSRSNHAWAQTVPMEACFGLRDNDHSFSYVVDGAHSCLTDCFINRFRQEQAKEKEHPRRESVLGKLQKPLPPPTEKSGKDVNHER